MLEDPRHGERWARHCLDVIRFAESNGFETNRERSNGWRFRDYLIDAFKEEPEALAYCGNPIDTLAPLAKAKVALIHVGDDADDVVPSAENTAIIESRYRALGGAV